MLPPTTMVTLAVLAGGLLGCSSGERATPSLCGPSGQLKVGLVGGTEGSVAGSEGRFPEGQIFDLRDQLMAASRCPVVVEPVQSTDLARARLVAQEWDMGFLPPGLMAFSMEQSPPYVPLRTLGAPRQSRSSIVVPVGSPISTVRDLEGARVGLLPRGSLAGFYLPLYNLHGLRLSQVVYGLDFYSLLALLEKGAVDAIAWDEALPEPSRPLHRVLTDGHTLPLGSLVVREGLARQDLSSLLRSVDASARDLPPALGYVAGETRQQATVPALRAIVRNVESWQLPQNGQSYRVYAPRWKAP